MRIKVGDALEIFKHIRAAGHTHKQQCRGQSFPLGGEELFTPRLAAFTE